MKTKYNVTFSFPIGIFPIVGVMFVFLKLVGAIDWSWLLVLSPFWIPLGFVVAFFAVFAILASVSSLIIFLDHFLERR